MRETAGSAAAPAARCRKFRRGSFVLDLPSHHSITSSARARRAWRREFKSLGIRQIKEREARSIWHQEKQQAARWCELRTDFRHTLGEVFLNASMASAFCL
jgi:hypothetical protein